LRSLEQLLPLLQFFALQVFELLGCEGLVAVNMKVRLIMVDMPGIFKDLVEQLRRLWCKGHVGCRPPKAH